MTMGGNDVGFVDILMRAIVSPNFINKGGVVDLLNATWDKFYGQNGQPGIRDKLYEMYKTVSEKAGRQAAIIVAGYPTLLYEEPAWHFLISHMRTKPQIKDLFSASEIRAINNSVKKFNGELEGLVEKANKEEGIHIYFASVQKKFAGHEAYAPHPFINPVTVPAQSQDLKKWPPVSAYSIHPNSDGAAAYAECVQAVIDKVEKERASGAWDTVAPADSAGDGSGNSADPSSEHATASAQSPETSGEDQETAQQTDSPDYQETSDEEASGFSQETSDEEASGPSQETGDESGASQDPWGGEGNDTSDAGDSDSYQSSGDDSGWGDWGDYYGEEDQQTYPGSAISDGNYYWTDGTSGAAMALWRGVSMLTDLPANTGVGLLSGDEYIYTFFFEWDDSMLDYEVQDTLSEGWYLLHFTPIDEEQFSLTIRAEDGSGNVPFSGTMTHVPWSVLFGDEG